MREGHHRLARSDAGASGRTGSAPSRARAGAEQQRRGPEQASGRVNVRPQSVQQQRLLHPQGRKGDLSPGPWQPPSDHAIGAEASTSRRAAARPPALALRTPVTATSQQEHSRRPRGRAPRERQVTDDATARGTAPGPHARGHTAASMTRDPAGAPSGRRHRERAQGAPGRPPRHHPPAVWPPTTLSAATELRKPP